MTPRNTKAAEYVTPWWQAAMLPERWDVCGVVVPSLSLWAVYALRQIGNPYICGLETDRDGAAALLLCAGEDVRGLKRLLSMPRYRARRMLRMFRRLRRVPWPTLHAACRDYVESCSRVVSRWRPEESGSGSQAACPGEWHIMHALCAEYGMTVDEAWATPFALARCLYDVAAEANGDKRLMSETAQEMEDNWEAYKDS